MAKEMTTVKALQEKFENAQRYLIGRFGKDRARALNELDVFCKELGSNASFALESADHMFENAAKAQLLPLMINRLKALSDVRVFALYVKECEEAVVFGATRGSRSTSDCRNLMEEMRLAVRASATKDMRELLDGIMQEVL